MLKHRIKEEVVICKEGKSKLTWLVCECGSKSLVIYGFGYGSRVVISSDHNYHF